MHTPRFERSPSRLYWMVPGLLLLGCAMPALASDLPAGSDKSWGAFFGRTHVLWLHLPIGLLIGAFTLELFGFFKRSKGYDVAAGWLFVLGALSTVPAVLSGLLLGTEWAADNTGGEAMTIGQLIFADSIEQGVTETLGWHMWLGLTLMVVAFVAAVLKVLAVRRQWTDDSAAPGGWPLGVSRLALIGTMALLPFAGHLGGNMTHGPEFLVERAPFDVPDGLVYWPEKVEGGADPVPGNGEGVELVNGTVAFWNAKIQPALNDHCIVCHNAGKQNGKLRLDTLEWAMKGGKVGGTIEPGDAEFSEIYRRVILPPSHEEFMPTNVEKYGMLSQEEVILLGEWLTEFSGELNDGSVEAAAAKDPEPKEPEPAKPLVDPATVRAIEQAGGSAKSLSLTQPELSVKLAYLKTLSPDTVADLAKAADQIAWLTFEGSVLDDAAVAELPAMPKLTQLNLKDTGVTDAGLEALPEFPKLEWLNLFGTEITDSGLEALAQYGSLKKVYLTGTGVSEQAVANLRAALPGAQVFSDHDGVFDFKPDEPEPEQASAKPINDKCPVSGAPVKDGFVSTFEGKTVGFCCNNCKGKFDADPKQFAGKLPE